MKWFSLALIITLLLSFALTGCKNSFTSADLVLLNGQIYTVEDPTTIHQAIAIKKDKILKVGSNSDIDINITNKTTVIDLDGKTVLPGFIDSHAHFMNLGYLKLNLDLNSTKSWEEILQLVESAVKSAKPGDWIEGRGWHQEKWGRAPDMMIEGYPVHKELSNISPNNPVYLKHASGHAILVNQMAIDLASVSIKTNDPEGGKIVRAENRLPTGIFLENAKELIDNALNEYKNQWSPREIEDKDRRAYLLASKTCLQNGITTFHDAGSTFEEIRFFHKMVGQKQASIRLWVMVNDEIDTLKKHLSSYKIINFKDLLTVRAIKLYMDGALGVRGAWLLKPYSDLHTTSGFNDTPIEELRECAKLALDNGFQVCMHAIGDRGNRETLNIYEETFSSSVNSAKLRWRIEHAQHLNANDIERFHNLGIIAAIQSIHCVSDGPWVPQRLGDERSAEGAYVWQKLLKSGAIICNGTDSPVEDINPIVNFHAAITRRLPDGSVFYPNQCMTRHEALRSYTIDAAYAGFEEDTKGTLTSGKLADMVVLSKDIMKIAAEEILTTEVLYTIIGGKILYKNPNKTLFADL
jgi:predicted amidohydrolase YtcJ